MKSDNMCWCRETFHVLNQLVEYRAHYLPLIACCVTVVSREEIRPESKIILINRDGFLCCIKFQFDLVLLYF